MNKINVKLLSAQINSQLHHHYYLSTSDLLYGNINAKEKMLKHSLLDCIKKRVDNLYKDLINYFYKFCL